MTKIYETPFIQIVEFELSVETESSGGSIVVNWPWEETENEGFFE